MAQLTLTQMGYSTLPSDDHLDFVMDFDTMKASFMNLAPDKSHTLVASIKMRKASKKAWRVWKVGDEGDAWSPKILHLGVAHSIPVLKSNLQKAVRVRDKDEAVRTALEMLAIDRMELYRRLPIISVEDTSLVEGTATIVWLMMAGERGPMLSKTAEFIMRYVSTLCDCANYFPNRFGECSSSHSELVTGSQYGNDIASLRVREAYGGMKGDMRLLNNAIAYYHGDPSKVCRLSDDIKQLPKSINFDHIVIAEAIDYHPCPWILKKLAEKTTLDQGTIKAAIWVGDSGMNVRKKWTIERQNVMRNDEDYIAVSYHLRMIRSNIERGRYKQANV